MPIDSTAAAGFQLAADAYDRGRPEYPPAALDAALAALRLAPGDRLLDLGAGTGPLAETRFPHVHALTPDGVVDRVASVSFIAAMPELERAAVLAEVRALLASHPDTAGRPTLDLAYRTDLYWCERR